jgi:hypothetical protein
MTLTLSFPPEIEKKLLERAAATGKDLASVIREAVEEKLISSSGAGALKTTQQWEAEFNAWVSGRKVISHFVDDSRESIYSGRGE